MPADQHITGNLIILNDYASAFDSIGISLAELDEGSITFQEFADHLREKPVDLSQIANAPTSFITGWGQYADTGLICDKNIGYSMASIDADIRAGMPPHIMTAVIGRYDPDATRDALKNQAEWPAWAVDAYSTQEYHGVTIHTWGVGYETHIIDRLVPPHIDSLGRATPLAVSDGRLFNCTDLEYVKAMIDASQDKTESLADLPEYAEIAVKMSELGVFSLILGDESIVNGNPEEFASYPGPLLKKFLAFGSAPGTDENGTFMALVLYHKNHEDAQANVSLLQERIDTTKFMAKLPWTEIVTESDIQTEGNLLVAKLYTEQVSFWDAWVYNRDSLVLHEKS